MLDTCVANRFIFLIHSYGRTRTVGSVQIHFENEKINNFVVTKSYCTQTIQYVLGIWIERKSMNLIDSVERERNFSGNKNIFNRIGNFSTTSCIDSHTRQWEYEWKQNTQTHSICVVVCERIDFHWNLFLIRSKRETLSYSISLALSLFFHTTLSLSLNHALIWFQPSKAFRNVQFLLYNTEL